MFTGIVEKTTEVTRIVKNATVEIDLNNPFAEDSLEIGSSFAVNGCCLTLLKSDTSTLTFEMGKETLEKTTFAHLQPGSRVNIERALKAHGRIDGHFVSGHVDCVGIVDCVQKDSDLIYLSVQIPSKFLTCLIYKGSITINGVSLTVNDVARDGFRVALLPYTYELTNLAQLNNGDGVNVEFDMMGKYVIRYLETHTQAIEKLGDSLDALKELTQ